MKSKVVLHGIIARSLSTTVQFINIPHMRNVYYIYKVDSSFFMDRSVVPTEDDLKGALGKSYNLWKEIRDQVIHKYPEGIEDWNFPGKKYGWSFRIKDKKRAIIYLLPREDTFMAAFVFGHKAFDAIMQGDVSEKIKSELASAKVYAEGRGIRIPVHDRDVLGDIFRLIDYKLAF